MPELKARFAELQSEAFDSTPDQMRDMIRRATEQWSNVINSAKIRID